MVMLKAAVIGCGRMGARPSEGLEQEYPYGWLPVTHIEALQEVDQIELIAICDSNTEALNKAAAHFGIAKKYCQYSELILREKPDLLTIATRTPVKKEIIEFACLHGVKGIYVEKPLANSHKDAQIILKLLSKYNVRLSYGVNRRFHNIYRKAKDFLRSGEIGRLTNIEINFGRSLLFWTHPHSVDLMLFFSNEQLFTGVSAMLDLDNSALNRKYYLKHDPYVENASFYFNSGVIGAINNSSGMNVQLGGTKGNMVIHANGNYLEINTPATHPAYFTSKKIINGLPNKSATIRALENLRESMLDNEDLLISPEEIITGLDMLLGCVQSSVHNGVFIDRRKLSKEIKVDGRFNGVCA
jgi:scyllo-inositol 2-dehydrogenase (NAD+)